MCRPNLIFSYLSGTENFAALRLTLPHSRRQSRGHSSFHRRLIVIDDERRDCKWSDANYLRNRRRYRRRGIRRVDSRIHQGELIAYSDIVAGFEADYHVTLDRGKNWIVVNPQHVGGATIVHWNTNSRGGRDCTLDSDEHLIEADIAELPDYAGKCWLTCLHALDPNYSCRNHQPSAVLD